MITMNIESMLDGGLFHNNFSFEAIDFPIEFVSDFQGEVISGG